MNYEKAIRKASARVSATASQPTAQVLICDTGALSAGDYLVEYDLVVMDTTIVGCGLHVQHRDVANANTVNHLGGCGSPGGVHGRLERVTIAEGERIRIVTGPGTTTAASRYTGHLAVYPVPSNA